MFLYQCLPSYYYFFLFRALLLKHEQVHAGEGQIFTCSSCPRTFPDPDLLNEHALSHSEMKKRLYICQACGQTFRSQSLLTQHNQQNHPHLQQSRVSQQLSQQIQQSSQVHQRPEQPHHLCSICSKVSYSMHSFIWFFVLLLRNMSIKCTIFLVQPFPDVSSLRHHELLHSNTSKEYPCSNILCNAVFTLESQLQAHLLMHESHKPLHVPSSLTTGSSSNYQHRHTQQHLIPAHEIPQQALPHHGLLQRDGTYVLESQDLSGQAISVHHLVNQIPQ